jgi:hypothetical protein
MIVDQFHVTRRPILEAKNNAPVGAYGNGPKAFELSLKRVHAHAVFTPGQPDWLDNLDAALALKPDSMKGYTIGDNTHQSTSRYPWRMDDEKVAYKAYEKFVKAGVKNVCVHKGPFPPSVEKSVPNLRGYVDVSDVGQAAKDWPQLNFVIYHSGYRYVGDLNIDPALALAEFERTGRIAWVSDLADIPEQYGVDNVYGDLGQVIAMTLVGQPHLCPGNPSERAWPRTHLLGNRCPVDRLAPVADRRAAPARDPGGNAEKIWVQTAGDLQPGQ